MEELGEGEEGRGRDPIAQVLDGVVRGLEWTGHRIADVGAWLRERLAGAAEESVEGAGAEGEERGPGRRGGVEGILKKVGQVAVLLVMIIVFRRAGLHFARAA